MFFINYKNMILKLLGTENRFIDTEELYYETQSVVNDDQLGSSTYPVPYMYSPYFRQQYYKWRYGKKWYLNY